MARSKGMRQMREYFYSSIIHTVTVISACIGKHGTKSYFLSSPLGLKFKLSFIIELALIRSCSARCFSYSRRNVPLNRSRTPLRSFGSLLSRSASSSELLATVWMPSAVARSSVNSLCKLLYNFSLSSIRVFCLGRVNEM